MAELHHEEAFLLSAANSIEADMIEAILNANDIPVLRKYRESGGYLKIYMGDTIYGVDLYVPQPLLDKAREIIKVAREASQDEDFAENSRANDEIPEEPMNNGTAGEDEIPEENKLEKESKEEKCDMSDNEELILQEEKVNRKRRLNSWIILLLFTPGILWVIIALIVYLFEQF